jgi:tetratricopeptide (TPR) repeat protein
MSSAIALAIALVLLPVVSRAQEQSERYIAAAERLYESLEYERALAQFAQARRLPRSLAQDVRIALFEGLILSDMGMHEEAVAAFKSALLLEPEATLPAPTTPQVTREFEGLRKEVREELAARARKQQEARTEAAPVHLTPVSTPESRPDWLRSSVSLGKVSVPVPTLALLGGGAIAGGLGGIFGLQSRAKIQATHEAPFRDEMVARHGEAVSSARVANLLFGAAGLLGTGAVATWLFSSPPMASHEQESR